jgi:hypothetical protein
LFFFLFSWFWHFYGFSGFNFHSNLFSPFFLTSSFHKGFATFFPVTCRFLFLWGLPSLLWTGYRGLFPGAEMRGVWNWPLKSSAKFWNVELQVQVLICFHGRALN